MVAELCPLEEGGEPLRTVRARVEAAERPLHVLERSLRRMPRDAGTRERVLHARVRGDDRAAQVGIVAQVVDRLVERLCDLFVAAEPPRSRRAPCTAVRIEDDAGACDQRNEDGDLVPTEVWVAHVMSQRRLLLPRLRLLLLVDVLLEVAETVDE